MKSDIDYRILDVVRVILRHTKNDPIKAEQIKELTGIDPRVTAEIVSEATTRGFAICSGGRGYYQARDYAEFMEHCEKERRRAVDVLHKVHQGKRNYTNEITLFDIEAA